MYVGKNGGLRDLVPIYRIYVMSTFKPLKITHHWFCSARSVIRIHYVPSFHHHCTVQSSFVVVVIVVVVSRTVTDASAAVRAAAAAAVT